MSALLSRTGSEEVRADPVTGDLPEGSEQPEKSLNEYRRCLDRWVQELVEPAPAREVGPVEAPPPSCGTIRALLGASDAGFVPQLLLAAGSTVVAALIPARAETRDDAGPRTSVRGPVPDYHSVGLTGFEPAASSSRTRRATKLRHSPRAKSL